MKRLTTICFVMLCIMMCMAATLTVQAEIVYVDQTATSGADNGSSWADAYLDLQSALGPAVSGDSIWVAAGTYRPITGTNRDSTFQLISGVGVYGGFAGGETSLSERDWETNVTILSGDIGTLGVDTDNSYNVVTGSGTDATAVLDGFTVTKGYAVGGGGCYGGMGGGMVNSSGSPTVKHVIFTSNYASYGGGMCNCNNSEPTIINVTFSNNSADYTGGGMMNIQSDPTLINALFLGNSGFGIANEGGSISTLINVTMYGNSSYAIINDNFDDHASIYNSILWNNGSGSGIMGGGCHIAYSLIENSFPGGSWDISLGTNGGNNLDADPLFIDAPNDLRLIRYSPAVNAGDDAQNPSTTDLDGNPRIRNGTIDMGVYESQEECPAEGILYVDADAVGSNDGSSWINAFTEVYSAIQALVYCPSVTEIWVADGTYKPAAGTDRDSTFQLVNGVGIYGGFAGWETNRSERDWETNVTILSGDIGTPGVDTDNSYNVVTGSGTNSTAVLDGFTVTKGYAVGGGGGNGSMGGGMVNENGSPTVEHVIFASNYANWGGGMANWNYGDPTMIDVTFSNNSSAWDGGGMLIGIYCSPVMSNITFANNNVPLSGGGLYSITDRNVSITDATFTGNSAGNGGGINFEYSTGSVTSTLTDVIFDGNSAGSGGGIYIHGNDYNTTYLYINNAQFIGNTANWGGGMVNGPYTYSKLRNVLFRGNSATGDGGAISQAGDHLELANVTIVGNTAANGGGLHDNGYNYMTTISNSIFWNNTATTAGDQIYKFVPEVPWPGISYSLIEGCGGSGSGWDESIGVDNGHNIDIDPLLMEAPDNLHLIPISPAVDAGYNSGDLLATDLDGNPRIHNGTVDMGAYESQATCPSGNILYVDVNSNGTIRDGSSWTEAFPALWHALEWLPRCSGITEIWVAAGTYLPTGGTDRTVAFELQNGIAIYGGFVGVETFREERDWLANETVLSGDIGAGVDASDNSYHVVKSVGTDATAVLDGFTITAGNANASVTTSSAERVGSIDTRDSKPSLAGPPITGSRSDMAWIDTHGGGIYNKGGTPTLGNLHLIDNYAVDGGGIYNDSGSPAITNVRFSNNSGIWGAAMHNYDDSSPILANVTFWNGSADFGGGIYNNWSEPYLVNSAFSYNSAYRGGGIYNNMSDPFIVNTILWGNTATSDGYEIFNASSTPNISYSIVEGSGGSASWDTDLGTDGGNNLDANPLFTDASTGILRPLGGSPAIDAGDDSALYLPSTDLDGNARILGTAVDIGAHEYPCPPGTVLYVDADATAGANDGTSWTDAFTELYSALQIAQFCPGVTEIWVAEGTYKPTGLSSRTASFNLVNDMAIYGGFDGWETSVSERDWSANMTILSGDIGVTADSTDNSYHVVTGSGTDSTAVLDGFTITGGYADGPGILSVGGGMYNDGGSPTIANVTISGNNALVYGGGMKNDNSSNPTLTNVIFSGNSAGTDGGGMNNAQSDPTLINVIFTGNSANDYGGGLVNWLSVPTLTNVTFSNNSANYGGGVVNNDSDPTLVNTILWGDSAVTDGDEIYNMVSSVPVISYSLIEGCGDSGGGWDTSLGTDGGKNLDADPLFVDGPGGDLHLSTPSSPAVNTGNSTAVPAGITTDLDGNGRIVAEAVDMGAYEYPCLPGPVLYVDVDAGGGALDGSSWSDAFTDLRKALGWSSCGGVREIWVADGTYRPTAGTDRTISFQLSDSIIVYGGFAGTETDTSQRDWNTNVAILSGDIGTPAIPTDNSYHVVTSGVKPGDYHMVTLDGFTVRDGWARGSGYNRCGAGIFNIANITVNNVKLLENQSVIGGGMYTKNDQSPLTNVTFEMNWADSAGGGLYCDEPCFPILTNVLFQANNALHGGGIFQNMVGNMELNDVTFDGNMANDKGGGLYCRGDLIMNDTDFRWNDAARGGGIYNFSFGAIWYAQNIYFEGNHAFSTGGAICNYQSHMVLNRIAFIYNYADSAGGAIFNNVNSVMELTNGSLVGNNGMYNGGGIYNGSNTLMTLTNVTAANNQADWGGAIYNTNISNHVYYNNILWGNAGLSGGDEIYNDMSNPSIAYSLIDASGGSGGGWDTNLGTDLGFNLDDDPLFVDYFGGDLHLQIGSPAIDSGYNDYMPYPYDLDGNPRIMAGVVDMGAYEFQEVPSAAADPQSVLFTDTPINQTSCDTIYIINEGGAPCTLSGIYGCTTTPLSIDTSMTDHTIAAHDTTIMLVCVTPTSTDPDSGEVTIVSDAWNSSTKVPVKLQNVIVSAAVDVPRPFNIVSVSPNPFNPSTTVFFTLPSTQPVTAAIWSVTGARVRTLATGRSYGPGTNQLHWDGYTDQGGMAASGVYFVRIQTPLGVKTARAVLLK